jgi:hypothetical protein
VKKLFLPGIAVLFLATGTAHAKAIFQCGPIKFAAERDAKSDSRLKGWKLTWLAGPLGADRSTTFMGAVVQKTASPLAA